MSSPVAYFVFNRPECTEATFQAIRRYQPEMLFIIADGPRESYPLDAGLCNRVRKIVEDVGWPCQVKRDYATRNIGLKHRISSGLNWVFAHVDRAIVLEDDCLAHDDFFRFCDELLEHYEQDERVWVITGDNFQGGTRRGEGSYYFSKYNHCWGWASWRRAWEHYEGNLPFWPAWRHTSDWRKKTLNRTERRYWENIFDRVYAGSVDSWAYPWTACVWYHGGLTATPNTNLVANIGFGSGATHTVSVSRRKPCQTGAIGKIEHPSHVQQNKKADLYVFKHHFGGRRKKWYGVWLRRILRTAHKVGSRVKSRLWTKDGN